MKTIRQRFLSFQTMFQQPMIAYQTANAVAFRSCSEEVNSYETMSIYLTNINENAVTDAMPKLFQKWLKKINFHFVDFRHCRVQLRFVLKSVHWHTQFPIRPSKCISSSTNGNERSTTVYQRSRERKSKFREELSTSDQIEIDSRQTIGKTRNYDRIFLWTSTHFRSSVRYQQSRWMWNMNLSRIG